MAAPPDLDIEQALLDFQEAQEEKDKSIKIFGKSIREVPCFRDSFMTGILGGLGVGLLHFMFTSKPLKSSHVGMGSYVGITVCYWVYCRVNYARKQQEMERFKSLVSAWQRGDTEESVKAMLAEESAVIVAPKVRSS